jgi:hypothetical protein
MPDNKPKIIVRFISEGFHYWPNADGKRAYLAARHRHLFHVQVETEVTHDDREIEFHDLLDDARSLFPTGELGTQSCESLARSLGEQLAKKYRRPFQVAVFEDNEVGSSVAAMMDDVSTLQPA